MNQIRLGLQNNVEVSLYANLEFNEFQMELIRLGLERNIDVSIYANPNIDYKEMETIFESLI